MGNQLASNDFYNDIIQILSKARGKAHTAVNSAMVEAYWFIGKRIVKEEQNGESKAKYGARLLENLSSELSSELGKGFSYANLRNFRQFYLTYPTLEICYTLCSKLGWSHNRLIMRIENRDVRNYYLKEAAQQNWSVRQLERNIKSDYYQRILSTQYSSANELPNSREEQIFASKYQKVLPTEEELIAEINREKRMIEQKFSAEGEQ